MMPSLLQSLASMQNMQGNSATVPDSGDVRDAALSAAAPALSPGPARSPFLPTGPNTINDLSFPSGPSPAPQTAPASPQRQPTQPQQGPNIQDVVQQILGMAQPSKTPVYQPPVAPNIQMSPETQQFLQSLRDQANQQFQQATQIRNQAAQLPVPQQQRLGLLASIIPALVASHDRSGKFANEFLSNFQTQAQGANQGQLQQYEQQQNAANLQAQGLESQANRNLAQVAAQIQQQQFQQQQATEQYRAELGYGGKAAAAQIAADSRANVAGIRSLTNLTDAQVRQQAQQLVQATKSLTAENAARMAIIRNPQSTSADRQFAVDALRTDPANANTYALMDPATLAAVAIQTPAVQLKEAAQTAQAQALAQKYHSQSLTEDELRDPRKQNILATIDQLESRSGLNDQQAQYVAKKVAGFDFNQKLQAMNVYSKAALTDAKIAQLQANPQALPVLREQRLNMQAEQELLSNANKQILTRNGGKIPGPDANNGADLAAFMTNSNRLDQIKAQFRANEDASEKIKTGAQAPIVPNVPRVNGGAAAYGSTQPRIIVGNVPTQQSALTGPIGAGAPVNPFSQGVSIVPDTKAMRIQQEKAAANAAMAAGANHQAVMQRMLQRIQAINAGQ